MVPRSVTRRAMLSGVAGGMVATSGCLGELQNIAGRERQQQVSVSIATLPVDEDPYAMRIATILSENLSAAGIEAQIEPMTSEVLLRNVLINHDFDLYVARYPDLEDPDQLRSLLYSRYAEEAGWQNPFGYGNIRIDELLEKQRRTEGETRQETVRGLQMEIVQEQPFTVIAFPDQIAAIRPDRFVNWPAGGLRKPLSYLGLVSVASADTLELLTTDKRITRNRNPIAAEHRNRGVISGLLYEPLVRGSTESIPWLAREIEWSDRESLSATVTIRETPWHDGTELTAGDVAFTYRFLADTSLGAFDTVVPTPRGRGRISLVDSVELLDDRRIRFEFETRVREIARRAFSNPILPEHVWRDRAERADIAGIDVVGGTTEALVWPNEEPVGSGPLQFIEATPDEEVVFERFEDHFLVGGAEGIPEAYTDAPTFDRLRFQIVPSHDAAIELLENDGADATIGGLKETIVPEIGRKPSIVLSIGQSLSFYHVGYNCRRTPFSDPRFRRSVARLLDREMIRSEIFTGYAMPSNVPLAESKWRPPGLEWDDEAHLPFLGENGELDVELARETFREAGYTYDDDQLVTRGGT